MNGRGIGQMSISITQTRAHHKCLHVSMAFFAPSVPPMERQIRFPPSKRAERNELLQFLLFIAYVYGPRFTFVRRTSFMRANEEKYSTSLALLQRVWSCYFVSNVHSMSQDQVIGVEKICCSKPLACRIISFMHWTSSIELVSAVALDKNNLFF